MRIFIPLILAASLGACAASRPIARTHGSPPVASSVPARSGDEGLREAIDDLLLQVPLVRETPLFVLAEGGDAPPKAAPSKEDLAKKTQNPISDLISLPIQNNTGFNFGTTDGVQNITNIQPVYPVSLSEKWNLINRAIIPIVYTEAPVPGASSEFGLGDIAYTAFFSPADSGKVIWGIGPTVLFPTSTGSTLLGAGEWGLGASVIALTIQGPWVFGALAGNTWSFEGNVNAFLLQPFVNYNLPNGWYLSSVPIITANWGAPGGEQWTIPLGGGAGKITKIGKQPINIQVQAFYNVESPTLGAEWSLRLQIQFLFPK